MHFVLEHKFDCNVETFEKALDHPALNDYIARNYSVLRKREILEKKENGKSVFTKIRCVPNYDLPLKARKFVDQEHIEWVEETDRDRENHIIEYRIIPRIFKRQFTTYGRFTITPTPDGKTKRIIDGNVVVLLPGIGKKVEEYIVPRITRALNEEAEIVKMFLNEFAGELQQRSI